MPIGLAVRFETQLHFQVVFGRADQRVFADGLEIVAAAVERTHVDVAVGAAFGTAFRLLGRLAGAVGTAGTRGAAGAVGTTCARGAAGVRSSGTGIGAGIATGGRR